MKKKIISENDANNGIVINKNMENNPFGKIREKKILTNKPISFFFF